MDDTKLAETAIASFGQAIGVTLPAAELAQLGAFLAAKVGGKSWADAIAAGNDARSRITSEADAEASRRARMEDK